MSGLRIPRATHRSWPTHVAKLALALPQNATAQEAILAGRRLGWNPEFTRQVLAAAEGTRLVYYAEQRVWRKVA